MLIRAAIAADVPAILALERDTQTSAHYSEHQYEQVIAQGLIAHSSANLPNRDDAGNQGGLSRVVLVSEDDSEVRAFIVARVLGTEWEIENLVVAGDVRRRGFGIQLVNKLLDMAGNRGARKAFLEVRRSNTAARGLYEKLEFVETGRRKNYYHDPGEDAVLYTKDLSNRL